jgi:uncharacterized repeat protein (TIGR03847 family)
LSSSFDLPEPSKVTIWTVGPAGGRTFYLQARQEDRLVTLKLEKQQVGALAELLTGLLSDLAAPGELPEPDTLELEEPVLPEWVVGSMQLSFDPVSDRIVLLAEELTLTPGVEELGEDTPSDDPPTDGPPATDDPPTTEDANEDGAIGRLAFTRAQAAALTVRGTSLVTAGRATCPLCGYPMDPAGHSCPKTNGHRAPTR